MPHLERLGKAPRRYPQRPLFFWLTKETVNMCLIIIIIIEGLSLLQSITVFMTPQMREPFLTAFWIDGKDILYHNMNFPDRAAARAVCLGSCAARVAYGGCDSARAARLGSHAARWWPWWS